MEHKFIFPSEEWEDKATYYLNKSEQRTKPWFDARIDRTTSSIFSTAAGHTMYKLPEDLADSICGISPRIIEVISSTGDKKLVPVNEVDDESRKRMDLGVKWEVAGRNWYVHTTKNRVIEYGLAVPKDDPYIGASTDGYVEVIDSSGNIIDTGLIEIKTTQNLYGPLQIRLDHADMILNTSYISKSHYDQIQGAMYILNQKWCDYIVVVIGNNAGFYKERIHFDPKYWHDKLYPKLKSFIQDHVFPRIKSRSQIKNIQTK